jgi:predicted dinucleotide-binding enzyme
MGSVDRNRAGASAGTVAQTSAPGIVVIAVPWVRVPEAVQGLEWNGQIVIDLGAAVLA